MPNLYRLAASANLSLLRRLLRRLESGHVDWLARQLMQDRFDPGVRRLAGFFDKATLAWKNKQYDLDRNGEDLLLRRLAQFGPQVIFDVGANVGDWSLIAARMIPNAKVHGFEIAPATADEFERNAREFPDRMVVNRFGLSDHAGEVQLYLSPDHHTANSTIKGVFDGEGGPAASLPAQVRTGDSYLRDTGIERVDFLKVDVEGAEHAVFAGFAEAFAANRIGMVQFEYGPSNLVTRHLLADFCAFFAERGFAVGKLYPEGVAFKPYAIEDEDFVGPNYVACHTSRPELIEALRCDPLTPL